MRGIPAWLKKQYSLKYDIDDRAAGVDISEGMLRSILTGGISLTVVDFIIWLFIIRYNSADPVQPLFWYVLNPLILNMCVFIVASVIFIRLRALKAEADKRTAVYELTIELLYMLACCGGYFFLRKFEMSFLLLVMPLVMLVLRRNSNFKAALVFLTAVYLIAQFAPVYILGEPRERIPYEANVLFGLWIIAAIMYLLVLTKHSTAYSYMKKEEEELKQNAFDKQLYEMSHDVRTPIHSIEGMSEMILRNNVSERTGRDIVIIREAASDILSALDKALESSRIEMTGDKSQPLKYNEEENIINDNALGTCLYAPKAQVLVVDDSQLNLNAIRALLDRTGIKLDCALSGQEALKLVSYNYYDVIMLDHMMPDMDGIETIHNIKRNPGANMDTPVIVITANDIRDAMGLYRREGFADCVQKPISGDELEAVLEKYLPSHLVSRRKL